MHLRRFPAPSSGPRLAKLAAAAVVLLAVSCDEDQPKPPTQQAVEQSWQRTDQAVQQAAEAEQQVRHERRLRDIDRLRSEAQLGELLAHATVLRGLALTLTLALLAALVWLAVEIRRRRVLAAVLHDLAAREEVNHASSQC